MKNRTKEELGKSLFQMGNIVAGIMIFPQFLGFLLNSEELGFLGVIAIAFGVWTILHLAGIAFFELIKED